jgi:hypothetical protein
MGALPSLYAATVADVSGGEFYGPGGTLEMTGYPRLVSASASAHDRECARKLWERSAELTGVGYEAIDRV